MVSVTVYDGAEGIGGNKIFVEEGGCGVFLDFGRNFGKCGAYFEEYLKNRDTRGVHDLLALGLLPRINNYRPDLIPADSNISGYPALNVGAVLISHAHADHVGSIGYLKNEIPILASPLTIAILKGMQDSGMSSIDNEVAYISERKRNQNIPFLLDSDRSKPYQAKNFYCTTPPSRELVSLVSTRPGQERKRAKKYQSGICCHFDGMPLPFRVEPYEVDHSIFGATAYILEGDATVAYTGDFRLHGKLGDQTRNFVHNARKASVLITEGTRAGRDRDVGEEEGSERSVHETCLHTVEDADGLVIADFSPRNFERLESFLDIAGRTGRHLVVTAKDLYMLHALECADGVCRIDPVFVYDELTNRKTRIWETEVVREIAPEYYCSILPAVHW